VAFPPARSGRATRGSVACRGWEFKGNLQICGLLASRLRRSTLDAISRPDHRRFRGRDLLSFRPFVLLSSGRASRGKPPPVAAGRRHRRYRRHRRPAHGRPKAEDAEAKRRNNARPVMRRRCAAGPGWTYERGLSGQHDAGVAIDLISDDRVEGLFRPQNLGAGLGASFRYFSGLYFASCGCA